PEALRDVEANFLDFVLDNHRIGLERSRRQWHFRPWWRYNRLGLYGWGFSHDRLCRRRLFDGEHAFPFVGNINLNFFWLGGWRGRLCFRYSFRTDFCNCGLWRSVRFW